MEPSASQHYVETQERAPDSGAELRELVRREAEFRMLVESTTELIVKVDAEGRFTFVSPSYCELFGKSADELLGRTFMPLVHPEDQESTRSAMEALRDPPHEAYLEQRALTRHGWRWLAWSDHGIVDAQGRLAAVVGVGRDITAQKEAEHALRASEEKFRNLVESLQQEYLFYRHDVYGVFDYVSPSVTQLLGYSTEEFRTHYSRYLTGDPVNLKAKAYTDACIRGETVPPYELEIRHKNGDIRRLRLCESPLRDAGGRVIGVQGIAQDVTGFRRARLALDGRNQVLELLAQGYPLKKVLTAIVRYVEALDRALLCSIHLLDEKTGRLHGGAAPSLPAFYNEAVEGIEIGMGVGSCGTAAVTGRRVIVADILSHPYWARFRPLMVRTPLRACWSEPVLSRTGSVLGTFALYFTETREPTDEELEMIRSAAGLAAIVIEHDRSERAVRKAEEQARVLLESSKEGIFGLDAAGHATFINPAAARMLGYDPGELVGRDMRALVHHSYPDGSALSEGECRMRAAGRSGQDHHVDDEVFWRRDGSSFPVEYWATPIRGTGAAGGAVVTFHDISARRKAEQEIQHLAFHDSLTGLPNRLLFKEELRQALRRYQRDHRRFALHMLDLDHFKDVNDSLGHPVGDELLRRVAERIGGVVRAADVFSRLGGDEFALIQSDLNDISDASMLASKVIGTVKQDLWVDGNLVRTNASIGVIVPERDDIGVDELMSRADVALYKAKDAGRGTFAFFADAMTARLQEELDLVQHLSHAADRDQLYLEFQPQYGLDDGRLVGLEALVRWRHPERGRLLPGDFLGVAERRGFMRQISDWVLTDACRQARAWRDQGLDFGRIAVNLSASQVNDPAFYDGVAAILEATGADPSLVELELTETVLMEATDTTLEAVERLSERGMRFAIDDFGTGFSSLSYLRKFHAHNLKIDREFVRDVGTDPSDAEIVKATIALAAALGLTTTAEGVESAEQVAFLRRHGCSSAQGWWYGHPMSAEAAERLLAHAVRSRPAR